MSWDANILIREVQRPSLHYLQLFAFLFFLSVFFMNNFSVYLSLSLSPLSLSLSLPLSCIKNSFSLSILLFLLSILSLSLSHTHSLESQYALFLSLYFVFPFHYHYLFFFFSPSFLNKFYFRKNAGNMMNVFVLLLLLAKVRSALLARMVSLNHGTYI